MQSKKSPETGTEARKYFGAELRRWREAAGLTQADFAAKVASTYQAVSHYETGRRVPKQDFVELADKVLVCGGALMRIWPVVLDTFYPLAFSSWLGTEMDAEALHGWQPMLVPGLLQTEAYARHVLSGEPGVRPEQVDERAAARLERQRLLFTKEPPMYHVLIDEGILHRPLGGRHVLKEQIEHLIQTSALPNVTIQVVPLATCAAPGLLGAFTIAQLPDGPDAVYVESASNPQVINHPRDVSMIKRRYDAIRSEAQSRQTSRQTMQEAVEKWT